MTNKKDRQQENSTVDAVPIDQRRARTRRKLVKTLVAGGGVAASVPMLPRQWKKPIVDTVLLPAHAQSSPLGTIRISTFVDGSGDGAVSGPYNAGTHEITAAILAAEDDDDTYVNGIQATLVPPPAVPQQVSFSLVSDITHDNTFNTTATAATGTGLAVFSDATDNNEPSDGIDFRRTVSVADGDGDGNPLVVATLTFDSPGYASAAITFRFIPA